MVSIHFAAAGFNPKPHQAFTGVDIPCPTRNPDEIIFRNMKPRNRIMLGPIARGGMKVGEVLKIRPTDIQDRKIILAGPKSGKGPEVVFFPQEGADRLKEYVKESGADIDNRLSSIGYNAARIMVWKAGRLVGIHLRPHDLRRCAATFASRSGTPIASQQGDHAPRPSFDHPAVSGESHGR
jgi:integrase